MCDCYLSYKFYRLVNFYNLIECSLHVSLKFKYHKNKYPVCYCSSSAIAWPIKAAYGSYELWIIYSFIHSYRTFTYSIAPLQENYSEALPIPAWLNRTGEERTQEIRSWEGGKTREEDIPGWGPTTGKARFCLVEVRSKATRRRL